MSKEYLEALEIIKKYAKNDGWADGWTIEFWNMTEKELTILDKVFKNEIPKTGLMDYNSNPSEALECSLKLYKMVESAGNGNGFSLNEAWKYHNTIKQALLKQQEPKQYLKWEDLEFKEARCQYSNVKLGNANFQMTCYLYKGCMKKVWIRNEIISFELKDTEEDKQFFNDLHLERVEE